MNLDTTEEWNIQKRCGAGHTVFIIKIPGFQYEHKSGVKAGCENEILCVTMEKHLCNEIHKC